MPETLDMTFDGLGEMFEGDSADMCGNIFSIFLTPAHPRNISASVDGGLSRGSSVRRPGSEDPHRRLRKF